MLQQPDPQPSQPVRSKAQQDIDEYFRQVNAELAGVPAAYVKLAKSGNPEEAARGQRLVNEQLALNEVRRQDASGIISANEAANRIAKIAAQTQQAEMAAQQARIPAEQERLNRQLQQLRIERE